MQLVRVTRAGLMLPMIKGLALWVQTCWSWLLLDTSPGWTWIRIQIWVWMWIWMWIWMWTRLFVFGVLPPHPAHQVLIAAAPSPALPPQLPALQSHKAAGRADEPLITAGQL